MRAHIIACAIVAGMAILPGCASTLTRYYTLDMRPSPTAAASGLAIRHITLADSLAGMSLPIHTSPTSIEYYEGVQWTGSLEDILKEKFQAEFGSLPAAHAAHVVDGKVISFGQRDLAGGGAEAHAKIEMMVRESGDSRYAAPTLARIYEVTEPMDAATPESLTLALSRCVERIADMARADAAAL